MNCKIRRKINILEKKTSIYPYIENKHQGIYM